MLIITPGQEANGYNLGMFFRSSIYYCYIEFTHENHLDEEILINTHIVHFMIKKEKFPKISINICFLGLSREFPRDSKTRLN